MILEMIAIDRYLSVLWILKICKYSHISKGDQAEFLDRSYKPSFSRV